MGAQRPAEAYGFGRCVAPSAGIALTAFALVVWPWPSARPDYLALWSGRGGARAAMSALGVDGGPCC